MPDGPGNFAFPRSRFQARTCAKLAPINSGRSRWRVEPEAFIILRHFAWPMARFPEAERRRLYKMICLQCYVRNAMRATCCRTRCGSSRVPQSGAGFGRGVPGKTCNPPHGSPLGDEESHELSGPWPSSRRDHFFAPSPGGLGFTASDSWVSIVRPRSSSHTAIPTVPASIPRLAARIRIRVGVPAWYLYDVNS